MKNLSIAMVILTLTLSLSACGKNDPMPQTNPTTKPTATTAPATRPETNPTFETNIPDPNVNTSIPDMTGSTIEETHTPTESHTATTETRK